MEVDQTLRDFFNSIRENDVATVQKFLHSGISPHSAIGHITALGTAAYENHTDVCAALISAGADVNCGGWAGLFPLYSAAKKGNIQLIKLLIKSGVDLNPKFMNGNTALLEATKMGHYQVVRELIQAGADVHVSNNGGDTGLHIAATVGNASILREYLKAGVDVNIVKYEGVNKVSNTGVRPLHMAAYGPNGGHAHIAEILLDSGADKDAEMANGRTALHIAAMRNGPMIADVLIRRRCNLEPVSFENNEHKTPLMKAVDSGHLEMVRKLLQAGVDMNTVDIWGVTPLISAVFSGKPEIAKCLIQHGCSVNKASRSGMTPFQASLRHGPLLLIMLIQAGCRTGPPFDTLLQNSNVSPEILSEKCQLMVLLQSPVTLQQKCRLVVRERLGFCVMAKIQTLPFPSKLKDYLCMEELDSIFKRYTDGNKLSPGHNQEE